MCGKLSNSLFISEDNSAGRTIIQLKNKQTKQNKTAKGTKQIRQNINEKRVRKTDQELVLQRQRLVNFRIADESVPSPSTEQ